MRQAIWLVGVILVLGGCSTRAVDGIPVPGGPNADVVVSRDGSTRPETGVYARSVDIPAGHYPPPGECRVWYSGRPPGQQPPPGPCGSLVGRVPLGAFLLYNDKAWDTRYDWRRHDARRPGPVPDLVLRVIDALIRN